jgi:hypothetical protein
MSALSGRQRLVKVFHDRATRQFHPLQRKADCWSDGANAPALVDERRCAVGSSAPMWQRARSEAGSPATGLPRLTSIPKGAVLLPQVRNPQRGESAITPSESACGTLADSLRRREIATAIHAVAYGAHHQSRIVDGCAIYQLCFASSSPRG